MKNNDIYHPYIFKGYCCNFFVDKCQDKFLPKSFIIENQNISILYEHKVIIGETTLIKEDSYGLYLQFKLFKDIIYKMSNNYPLKLSIGFKCIKAYKKNHIRHIVKVKILEFSLVKNPAQYNTYFI